MSDEWDHFDDDDDDVKELPPQPSSPGQQNKRNQRRPVTPPSEDENNDDITNISTNSNSTSNNNNNINSIERVPPPPSDDDEEEEESPPTRKEMHAMFVRAGMSERTARLATDKVFTFDGIDWRLEDLTMAVDHEEGADFFLRVLNELGISGIGNEHVRQGILEDKFWNNRGSK